MKKINWGKVFTSKTIYLGIAAIAAGIAEYMGQLAPEASPATIIIGVAIIVMRFLSKDALID